MGAQASTVARGSWGDHLPTSRDLVVVTRRPSLTSVLPAMEAAGEGWAISMIQVVTAPWIEYARGNRTGD